MKTFDELKVGDDVVQYIKDCKTNVLSVEYPKIITIFQNTVLFNNGEPSISTDHINIVLNNGRVLLVNRSDSINHNYSIYLPEQIISATGELIELDWE